MLLSSMFLSNSFIITVTGMGPSTETQRLYLFEGSSCFILHSNYSRRNMTTLYFDTRQKHQMLRSPADYTTEQKKSAHSLGY